MMRMMMNIAIDSCCGIIAGTRSRLLLLVTGVRISVGITLVLVLESSCPELWWRDTRLISIISILVRAAVATPL